LQIIYFYQQIKYKLWNQNTSGAILNKKTVQIQLILSLLLFASTFIYAKNTVTISPVSGSVISTPICTVAVTSQKPADSVVFSMEFRSKTGTVRRKNIGTVRTAPYRMILPLEEFGNQYFFGANLIAAVHRQDDTIQIVNAPRLFFLPEPIPTTRMPLYPSSSTTGDSISVTYEPKGIVVRFSVPVTGMVNSSSLQPVTIILDPRLSRSPFPGSNSVILSVPMGEEAQLITSAEKQDSSMFTISRTGTPIHLKKQIDLKNNRFYGTVVVPDFLIGGTVPDSLGVNVIVPRLDDSGEPVSFVPGDLHLKYTPILFPLFVKSELPTSVKPVFPVRSFLIWFVVGLFVSALLVVLIRSPKRTARSLNEPGSDLIVLIEEHIANHDLSAAYLAAKLNSTVRLIHREMKAVTGVPFDAYVESQRIEIVKERLVSSNASEIAIASDCGFKSVSVMEVAFRRITGVAPYQFRQAYGVH